MGISISTPKYADYDGNLLFPPEILENVISFLNARDLRVAREVVPEWHAYIADEGILGDAMVMNVTKSEYILQQLSRSQLPLTFSRFRFCDLELTRQSLPFWKLYSDFITHLDFTDCAVLPRNSVGQQKEEYQLGCPNLKHLGLRSMDKYFMIGAEFLQLTQILCLEALESLDVSNNKYLSDRILFGILEKTKSLKSLDLSFCTIVFVKAVHNRFYPGGGVIASCFSDHILSFETLVLAFLNTSKGSCMEELMLKSTAFNSHAVQLISSPDKFHWKSVDFSGCCELKSGDYFNFISSQSSYLEKLVLNLNLKRLTDMPLTNQQFPHLLALSIAGPNEVRSLKFLENMTSLKHLNISGCELIDICAEDLIHAKDLEVLNMSYIRVNTFEIMSSTFQLMQNITTLNLGDSGDWVTDNLMQVIIKHLRRLKRLNLRRSRITDRGLAGTEVEDFENGSAFYLSTKAIETKRNAVRERLSTIPNGLSLSELTDLEDVALSHCNDLGLATWTIALRLPSLAILDLSCCPQITAKSVLSIAKSCPSLEVLNLLNCGSQLTSDPYLIDSVQKCLYRLRKLVI